MREFLKYLSAGCAGGTLNYLFFTIAGSYFEKLIPVHYASFGWFMAALDALIWVLCCVGSIWLASTIVYILFFLKEYLDN